jgi:hypothetical protein
MGPTADMTPVAKTGQLFGLALREMLQHTESVGLAPLFFVVGLGATLGHAGVFDYQREGSFIFGYTQHREFLDISNVNIGVFAQQAGLPEKLTLWLAGMFALMASSNARPNQPYFQETQNVDLIRLGYKIGASGVFDHPHIP